MGTFTQHNSDGLLQEAERIGEQRYQHLVELSPDAVMMLNDELCTYANANALKLFGAESPDELLGKPLLGMIQTDDWDAFHQAVLQLPLDGGVLRSEQCILRLDGTMVDIELAITSVATADDPQLVQLVAHDITERKRAQEQVRYLAYYDQLTNLPNREQLDTSLRKVLAQAYLDQQPVALLIFDVDGFHGVNTVYGEHVGDQVLEELAARLMADRGADDVVARYGNDEFILVLPNTTQQEAINLAKSIVQEIAEPFEIDGMKLLVSCHLGLSMSSIAQEMESYTLVQQSIMALHEAKAQDIWLATFNSRMADALTHRRTIEYHLHDALEQHDQLLVYFQPQMHLETMQLIGVEALVRWQHPEWGLVSPGNFIPVAEQTGLIGRLDELVFHKASYLIRKSITPDGRMMRVACNLSAREFRRPDLVEIVRDILDESGLDPEHFELEITESAVMENVDRALATLTCLRDFGIKLAIDDFGTGYSSLSYLTRFPVHTMKIDQSFIRNITCSASDQAVIKTIVTLAHTLNMDVLAEGVETQEQLAFLRQIGCDSIQGYLLGRPIPALEFNASIGKYDDVIETTLAPVLTNK